MDPNSYWNNQYRQLPGGNLPANPPAVRGYDLPSSVLDQAAALSGLAPSSVSGLAGLTPQPISSHPVRPALHTGHLPTLNYTPTQFLNPSLNNISQYKNAVPPAFTQAESKTEQRFPQSTGSTSLGSSSSPSPHPTTFPQFSSSDVPSTFPEPPPAHSNNSRALPRVPYQDSNPVFPDQFASTQGRSQASASPVTTPAIPSPYQSLSALRNFPAYNEGMQSSSPVNTSVSTNVQNTVVSGDGSYGTVSLQDLADISSQRQKMAPDQARVSNGAGQQHLIHQQLQHLAQPVSGPPQSGSPQMPMAGSPHTVNRMETNPVQHHSSAPVQAPADSTTKPKKPRARSKPRKKNQTPPAEKFEPPAQIHVPAAIHSAFPPNSFESQMAVGSITGSQCKYENNSPLYTDPASIGSHILAASHIMMDTPIPDFPEPPTDREALYMPASVSGSSYYCDDGMKGDDQTLEDNFGLGLNTIALPKKYHTKAEQKHIPQEDAELDEEFSHLSEEANGASAKNERGSFPSNPRNPHGKNQGYQPQAPPPPPEPPRPKPQPSAFQNSFLSFLQGNKPETLSSVTNSSVQKRPPIKYIPEPPRPKPPPRKKLSDSDDDKMGFSDDDDSKSSSLAKSQKHIKQTVSNVISSLDKPLTKVPQRGPGRPPSDKQKVPPLKISLAKVVIPTPKGKGRKSSASGRKKKKGDDEDFAIDDEYIPVRERSSRKAKEKAEIKKKQRDAIKAKRKKMYSDDDFSDPEDFIALSSDEEKAYDSDDDPAWNPKIDTQPAASVYIPGDSDDETSHKRKGIKLKAGPASAKKPRQGSGSDIGPYKAPVTQPILLQDSSDDEGVHNFQRGEFVIEKKEMGSTKSYPIWKLDAGRLLQKFECIVVDGKLLHRSLSTYTSWSEGVRSNYKAIKVKVISNLSNVETVEVLQEYKPRPVDPKLEEDPLIQPFNVYIQILLSQALEPGFLSAIMKENDPYYTNPMKELEGLVNKRRLELQERLGWTPNFKENVEKFPHFAVFEVGFSSGGTCQATGSDQAAGARVRLIGEEYNHLTLDGASATEVNKDKFLEFSVCQKAARDLRLYHKLVHFKYSLYRKCLAKTLSLKAGGQEISAILDQCMQNRLWVQNRFRSFKKLYGAQS